MYTGNLSVDNGSRDTTLVPRERVITSNDPKYIRLYQETAVLNEIPWRQEVFDFSRDRIPIVMSRIVQWYHLSGFSYEGIVDTVTVGKFSSGTVSKDLSLAAFIETVKKDYLKLSVTDDKILKVTGK